MLTWHNFLNNYLEPFSYLVYLLALVIYSRHAGWKKGKSLLVYYTLACLMMFYASYLVHFQTNNLWLYNTMSAVAAICISIYFYQLLEDKIKKGVVVLLAFLYCVYAMVKYVFLRGYNDFDSMGFSLLSACVAVYVFMYFHQLITHITELDILRHFNFWLTSSYLIYFLGNFIIFLTYYYFTQQILNTYTQTERSLLTSVWGLHNILLFCSAVSLFIGSLWLTYQKKLS